MSSSTGRSPMPLSRPSVSSSVNQRRVTSFGGGSGGCGRFESARTGSSTRSTTTSASCGYWQCAVGPSPTRRTPADVRTRAAKGSLATRGDRDISGSGDVRWDDPAGGPRRRPRVRSTPAPRAAHGAAVSCACARVETGPLPLAAPPRSLGPREPRRAGRFDDGAQRVHERDGRAAEQTRPAPPDPAGGGVGEPGERALRSSAAVVGEPVGL